MVKTETVPTTLGAGQLDGVPSTDATALNLRALIHREDDGKGFWAEVPVLPGCVSCGDTLEETRENITEAAAGVIEVIRDHNGGDYRANAPSLAEVLDEADPECDPQLYQSVLVHNYCQLFAKNKSDRSPARIRKLLANNRNTTSNTNSNLPSPQQADLHVLLAP